MAPSAPRGRRGATAAWLELSVVADVEAVEAVSEILGRYAPAGTSVEPAFDLVDEGLGARVDPTRPATVRAYVPAGDPAAAEAVVADVDRRALGHLQAFGLRPIGELQTRFVEPSPTGPTPGRTTSRSFVSDGGSSSAPPGDGIGDGRTMWCSPWIPGWRSGRASIRRLACASRRSRSSRTVASSPARASWMSAADRGSWPSRRSSSAPRRHSAWTRTRSPKRRRSPTRDETGWSGRVRAREGSLPSGESAFDVVLANLIAGVLVPLAEPLRDELRPGGILLASGIFHDREAAVVAAFEAAGLDVTERTAEGDWVALEARRGA